MAQDGGHCPWMFKCPTRRRGSLLFAPTVPGRTTRSCAPPWMATFTLEAPRPLLTVSHGGPRPRPQSHPSNHKIAPSTVSTPWPEGCPPDVPSGGASVRQVAAPLLPRQRLGPAGSFPCPGAEEPPLGENTSGVLMGAAIAAAVPCEGLAIVALLACWLLVCWSVNAVDGEARPWLARWDGVGRGAEGYPSVCF